MYQLLYYIRLNSFKMRIEPITFRIGVNKLRHQGHKFFDMIWRAGLMERDEDYKWLGKKLNLNPYECHFAKMKPRQIIAAIKHCIDFLNQFNRLHDYHYFKY